MVGQHTFRSCPAIPTDIDMNKVRSDAHDSTLRFAQRSPGLQAAMRLTAQLSAALHVDRLMDRLVRHPHLRIIGKSTRSRVASHAVV